MRAIQLQAPPLPAARVFEGLKILSRCKTSGDLQSRSLTGVRSCARPHPCLQRGTSIHASRCEAPRSRQMRWRDHLAPVDESSSAACALSSARPQRCLAMHNLGCVSRLQAVRRAKRTPGPPSGCGPAPDPTAAARTDRDCEKLQAQRCHVLKGGILSSSTTFALSSCKPRRCLQREPTDPSKVRSIECSAPPPGPGAAPKPTAACSTWKRTVEGVSS